LLNAFIDIRQQ